MKAVIGHARPRGEAQETPIAITAITWQAS